MTRDTLPNCLANFSESLRMHKFSLCLAAKDSATKNLRQPTLSTALLQATFSYESQDAVDTVLSTGTCTSN